jgi:hypothetical protein
MYEAAHTVGVDDGTGAIAQARVSRRPSRRSSGAKEAHEAYKERRRALARRSSKVPRMPFGM